uniref:Putative CMP/dCMP deaminase zinc-binding n=1 Tax=viral metagenome TaxID=1070528 RepID=A0A6M3LX63_9ZZZZ
MAEYKTKITSKITSKIINKIIRKLMNFQKLVKLSYSMLDLPDSKYKHFSFILSKNKILSVGYNLGFKSHPLAKQYGYRFNAIHSELKAIQNFPYPPANLSKCKIVNIRIMANNNLGMSRPCFYCSKLLNDFNLTEIWYTNRQGKFEKYYDNL